MTNDLSATEKLCMLVEQLVEQNAKLIADRKRVQAQLEFFLEEQSRDTEPTRED